MTTRLSSAGLMLDHRLRRWPNIRLASGQDLVLPHTFSVLLCINYCTCNLISGLVLLSARVAYNYFQGRQPDLCMLFNNDLNEVTEIRTGHVT